MLRLASGLGMLWRNVQRTTLTVLSISDVEVGSVQAFGVAITNAVAIAAMAGGLRQAALDHAFGGLEESSDEPLLTHILILRYAHLVLLSREK